LPVDELQTDDMLAIVNQKRSSIPAITHVDYSARIQTVSETKPDYYDLIKEFEKQTGYGVIVNTSFNVRGEPIVCSPRDSYTCFMRTNMDLLVLENCILYKQEQPRFEDMENWRETYELD
jgi:carbamoyltransferase